MMRAERLGDVAQLAAAEIEGELQDVVRQNITFWRRRPELSADSSDAIQALLARVTEASVQEIDQLIGRLEDMREAVRSEGERLRREVAAFADLNRSALASLKAIAETLPQRTEDKTAHREADCGLAQAQQAERAARRGRGGASVIDTRGLSCILPRQTSKRLRPVVATRVQSGTARSVTV
jgi:hypothetical protein